MSSPRRVFPYVQVDVFTEHPLEGNQLAVFLDARGLSDSEMQALARETKLSETTFILPREAVIEQERGQRVRIFTVAEELPFAGHPTLGTAFVLRQSHADKPELVTLDLNVGCIPVRFEQAAGGLLLGEMTQMDPVFGNLHDREDVARAAGLTPADLDPSLPIQTVSTGVPFTIVPLRSLKVAQDLRFSWHQAAPYLEQSDGKFFYFVTRETEDPKCSLHARMPFYNGEDPATGSAAGCCAAWAVAHGVAQPDEIFWVEQGMEMLRRSHIRLRAGRCSEKQAEKQDGKVVNVRVGGNVVEVMRGEVYL